MTGHAEQGADELIARQAAGVSLPNISDYWPDRRRTAPAEESPSWQVLLPTTSRPTVPTRSGSGVRDSPGGRRLRRPALLAGLLALVIGVGTVLLLRPTGDENDQSNTAAPPAAAPPSDPAPTGPASVAPPPPPSTAPTTEPSPEQTSRPPAAPPPPAKPLPERLHFVLDDGVTELSVRTSDLDDEPFRVSTPDGSGLDVDTTFRNGQLRVDTSSDGEGSGKLDVRLNKKIVWHVQLNAGVRLGVFELGTGTVSRIDLDGGAERFDVALGRLPSTLPIRMTGGVNKWRITTAEQVPVKVNIGNGAGDVDIYGRSNGGVGKRETIRDGDLRQSPGLDLDAAAGIGSLKISED